jgi:hypothetical protein
LLQAQKKYSVLREKSEKKSEKLRKVLATLQQEKNNGERKRINR